MSLWDLDLCGQPLACFNFRSTGQPLADFRTLLDDRDGTCLRILVISACHYYTSRVSGVVPPAHQFVSNLL